MVTINLVHNDIVHTEYKLHRLVMIDLDDHDVVHVDYE